MPEAKRPRPCEHLTQELWPIESSGVVPHQAVTFDDGDPHLIGVEDDPVQFEDFGRATPLDAVVVR